MRTKKRLYFGIPAMVTALFAVRRAGRQGGPAGRGRLARTLIVGALVAPVALLASGFTDPVFAAPTDCIRVRPGPMFFAVRHEDGTWDDFRTIPGLGTSQHVVDVAGTALNGELNVVAVDHHGDALHLARNAFGNWRFLGNIGFAAGDDGDFTAAATTEINGEMHVVLVTDGGGVRHTIRHGNGVWQRMGNVDNAAGDAGDVVSVATANVNGNLHVAMATTGGTVYHTIRFSTGWQPVGNVDRAAGDPGRACTIAAGEANGNLFQLVQVTSTGAVWHTLRHENGWDPLVNVGRAAGDPGRTNLVGAVGIKNQLHVVQAATPEHTSGPQTIYHTIRFRDGTWQPVARPPGVFAPPAVQRSLSAAHVGKELFVLIATEPPLGLPN